MLLNRGLLLELDLLVRGVMVWFTKVRFLSSLVKQPLPLLMNFRVGDILLDATVSAALSIRPQY